MGRHVTTWIEPQGIFIFQDERKRSREKKPGRRWDVRNMCANCHADKDKDDTINLYWVIIHSIYRSVDGSTHEVGSKKAWCEKCIQKSMAMDGDFDGENVD